MRELSTLILIIAWVFGIVVAKTGWSTFFATIMPLYAWYLTVEHFALLYNLI